MLMRAPQSVQNWVNPFRSSFVVRCGPRRYGRSVKQTIESLQAGRGIAAFAVVLHHSGLAAHDFGGMSLPLLRYGYLGVDFFFVLSGFIIFHSSVGRKKTLADYSLARFRRIYLPYWPVGIGIALLYLFLPSVSAGDRSWSWLPTLTLLPVTSETALSVAWTLKHEIFFYLLFGAAYFSGYLWPTLIAWAIAIGAATIAGLDVVPLQPINLEFLFGVVACASARTSRHSPLMLLGSLVSFALWLALGANRDLSFLVGLGIAFAVPPMVGAEWRGKLTVAAALVFLGDASYSLYLTHPIVTPIAGRLFRGSPWAILLAAILVSLIVGIAYHLMVERPLLRRSTPLLRKFAPHLTLGVVAKRPLP
jgi:peptidoglycan/LPS O-acetylase OafA/YrhL